MQVSSSAFNDLWLATLRGSVHASSKRRESINHFMALNPIEHEFGVPFPGAILPQEQWTQSALKRYPEGHINWIELFGRRASVVLDIGCGNGRYLIGSAVARPDYDNLGLDVLPVVVRYARKRANQRGLKNIKFAVGGGRELLADHVEPGTVAEIHCYHPQPYYDPLQVHRRLITPGFLALVHRTLSPAGLFVIQTDNPGYWRYIREICRCSSTSASSRNPGPMRLGVERGGRSWPGPRACQSSAGSALQRSN